MLCTEVMDWYQAFPRQVINIIILLVVEIEFSVLYMLDSVLLVGYSFILPC